MVCDRGISRIGFGPGEKFVKRRLCGCGHMRDAQSLRKEIDHPSLRGLSSAGGQLDGGAKSKVKGCRLYVISKEANEPRAVYVTEIWDSKEDHDLSLKDEGVKALIMKAVPLLDGPPSKGQELEVWGGLGI